MIISEPRIVSSQLDPLISLSDPKNRFWGRWTFFSSFELPNKHKICFFFGNAPTPEKEKNNLRGAAREVGPWPYGPNDNPHGGPWPYGPNDKTRGELQTIWGAL